ncbi:hypothetical protein GQ600_13599 [Phytophthora cactorum]|nr:hypothetical protein GQ600_13599 [Phytophthora cactorum]
MDTSYDTTVKETTVKFADAPEVVSSATKTQGEVLCNERKAEKPEVPPEKENENDSTVEPVATTNMGGVGNDALNRVEELDESTTETSCSAWRTSSTSKDLVVIVSPLTKTRFQYCQAPEAYLAEYQAHSFQSFRVQTNTTVAQCNNKTRCLGSTALLIPTDKRSRLDSQPEGCTAQVRLAIDSRSGWFGPVRLNGCVQVIDKANWIFAVTITRCRLAHNYWLTEHVSDWRANAHAGFDNAVLLDLE